MEWAGEELGEKREEGVVLGLSVSGACGIAASPKSTVGLNLKYALFLPFFHSSLSFLFLLGLNDFEYFSGVTGG